MYKLFIVSAAFEFSLTQLIEEKRKADQVVDQWKRWKDSRGSIIDEFKLVIIQTLQRSYPDSNIAKVSFQSPDESDDKVCNFIYSVCGETENIVCLCFVSESVKEENVKQAIKKKDAFIKNLQ